MESVLPLYTVFVDISAKFFVQRICDDVLYAKYVHVKISFYKWSNFSFEKLERHSHTKCNCNETVQNITTYYKQY